MHDITLDGNATRIIIIIAFIPIDLYKEVSLAKPFLN